MENSSRIKSFGFEKFISLRKRGLTPAHFRNFVHKRIVLAKCVNYVTFSHNYINSYE